MFIRFRAFFSVSSIPPIRPQVRLFCLDFYRLRLTDRGPSLVLERPQHNQVKTTHSNENNNRRGEEVLYRAFKSLFSHHNSLLANDNTHQPVRETGSAHRPPLNAPFSGRQYNRNRGGRSNPCRTSRPCYSFTPSPSVAAMATTSWPTHCGLIEFRNTFCNAAPAH